MKIRFLIVFFLTGAFLQAQTIHSELLKREQKSFFRRAADVTCAASDKYDVKYYCCYWNIDPSQPSISGSVTMNFLTLAAIDSLQMDVSITLVVDSVYYHNVKTTFLQQTGDVLGIHFPSLLAPNSLDSVKVYYHGSPASTGFGSFIQSQHGNGTPIVWTLSEPYGASDWWACKQTLNDKADSIDVFINTPAGNKAPSNGLLKQVIANGANTIFHWKHRYPIATYLICAASTNYTAFTDTVTLQNGKLPVLYYTYPEDSVGARQTDTQLLNVLKFYDSLFIPYPFMNEKYGMAQFGWGGGMEHQTMTFIGGYYIDLLAHELSHHWFGDYITCGSWTDLWLNEGFATYCTALAMERLNGSSSFRTWQQQAIGEITSATDGSVWVDDTANVSRLFNGRLTYTKGGYLLHMLRWVTGDNNFFTAVRNYANDPSLSYSFARTNMLQQHLEATSGKNLSSFFTQWFYGQGYPSYLAIWNQDENKRLKVTLNQSSSHPSVPFFSMPVPIEVKGEGHDTIVVFNHTYSGEAFFADLNFKVDSVVFDPDMHILSAQNKVVQEYAYLRSQMNLVIYPNPATAKLNVEVNEPAHYPTQIQLYDVLGRKVLDTPVSSTKFSIDVSEFSQGTYTLKLITGGSSVSRKIVIGKGS